MFKAVQSASNQNFCATDYFDRVFFIEKNENYIKEAKLKRIEQ